MFCADFTQNSASKTKLNNKIHILVFLFTLILGSCSGGLFGSSGGGSLDETKTGIFKDTVVKGLKYKSEDQEGITNSSGEFIYRKGSKVNFWLSNIFLGQADGTDVITPLDLVEDGDINNTKVNNIIKFLLSLDNDSNYNNGIEISETLKTTIEKNKISINLEDTNFDEAFSTFVKKLQEKGLTATSYKAVSDTDATFHFKKTYYEIKHKTPLPPANLKLTSLSDNAINISWDYTEGARYYKIYRTDSQAGQLTNIGQTYLNSFGNSITTSNKTYYFKVAACNDAGCSGNSDYLIAKGAITAPSAPTFLSATGQNKSEIKILWPQNQNTSYYKLFSDATISGTSTEIANNLTTTTYTHQYLDAGKIYYYKLKACNQAACSDFSSVISATTFKDSPLPLSAPTLELANGKVKASWTNSGNTTFYKLFRSEIAENTNLDYKEIYNGESLYFQDSNITPSKRYAYKIKACIGSNLCSLASDESVIQIPNTSGQTLSAPIITSIETTTNDTIKINWEKEANANYYKITRKNNLIGINPIVYKNISNNSYTDTSNLTKNHSYIYTVQACLSSTPEKCSAQSKIDMPTKFITVNNLQIQKSVGIAKLIPTTINTDTNLKQIIKSAATIKKEPFIDLSSATENNSTNVQRVMDIISSDNWNYLFPLRNKIYTYENFLKAVSFFPAFCNEAKDANNIDNICKKELATLFAHIVQESGKKDQNLGIPLWRQGLYYTNEHIESGTNAGKSCADFQEECLYQDTCKRPFSNPLDLFNQDKKAFVSTYTNEVSEAFPCGYKQRYYGRGAMQIKHNYNYGAFSDIVFGDRQILLDNPNLILEKEWLSFASAIWKALTVSPPKPSIHSVITGFWEANTIDKKANLEKGFGLTINILKGDAECGKQNENAQSRINYYKEFMNYFKLNVETATLTCEKQSKIPPNGAGDIALYWQVKANENECELSKNKYPNALSVLSADYNNYYNCLEQNFSSTRIRPKISSFALSNNAKEQKINESYTVVSSIVEDKHAYATLLYENGSLIDKCSYPFYEGSNVVKNECEMTTKTTAQLVNYKTKICSESGCSYKDFELQFYDSSKAPNIEGKKLDLNASTNQISINVDGIPNTSAYNIYKSANKDTGYLSLSSATLTNSTFIDTNVEANKYYYYKFSASNTHGTSGTSDSFFIKTLPNTANNYLVMEKKNDLIYIYIIANHEGIKSQWELSCNFDFSLGEQIISNANISSIIGSNVTLTYNQAIEANKTHAISFTVPNSFSKTSVKDCKLSGVSITKNTTFSHSESQSTLVVDRDQL